MDREYGASHVEDTGTNDVGIAPIREIGFSIPFGIAAQNVQGVAAKIHTGARLIELQFPGAGRAQRGAQTPGVYGHLQRQALEELSRASNVEFTTHASFSVMGLAGMDQQGNFRKDNKKFGLDEIKRAIEFAADVARGGNVTIHTGEFQRPISEQPWAKDENGNLLFKSFRDEPEEAVFRIVDDRNGQIAVQVRKNQKVARPVYRIAAPDEEYTDFEGNKRIAQEGEKVYVYYDNTQVLMADRVPEYESPKEIGKVGRFKVDYWDWGKFNEEAEERTKEARSLWQNRNKSAKDKERWEKSIYYNIFKDTPDEDNIKVRPEEAYVWATLDTNAANARGWSHYYGLEFDEDLERLKKLKKAHDLYKKIEENTPQEEQWKLLRETPEFRSLLPGMIPPEYKLPSELIEATIREMDRKISYAKEASTSQLQQARDTEETMRHVMSQERYALKEAYDSYAQAGLSAMEHSQKLEKAGQLKKPIFVAMEQIFPESYGGHPEELMDLVEGGRKEMIKMLTGRGYAEEEASKLAETHLKGHLDTGHINMWRKYWVNNPQLPPEENEKRFEQWVLSNVEKMAQKHMIGSVHLTDNFGYHDEHLAPGQGNSPVAEMVKILKKHDFKGALIVEPGADATTDLSDFHGLMKTWRFFGSPIYGVGIGGQAPTRNRAWGDVQYSYFGQMEPPYFTFGRYSPSEDWTLWSGVPME